MTAILQQFLSEAHDFLEGISEKLLQLESAPADVALMAELFRLVHTLKGNCGLFDFPEMSRVLHAAEDVMAVVRDGDLEFSQQLADCLLDALDFVNMLVDEIEASGESSSAHASASANLAQALRKLISPPTGSEQVESNIPVLQRAPMQDINGDTMPLANVPEALRMAWYRQAIAGTHLCKVSYTPEAECFFKGEDPFYQARQLPGISWLRVTSLQPEVPLAALDAYCCTLQFEIISTAGRAAIEEHFRYVPEQIEIVDLLPHLFVHPSGEQPHESGEDEFVSGAISCLDQGDVANLEREARILLAYSPDALWCSSALRWLLLIIECEPDNHHALRAVISSFRAFAALATVKPTIAENDNAIVDTVIAAQLVVLTMSDAVAWLPGRLKAVVATLTACYRSTGREAMLPGLNEALEQALLQSCSTPLRNWLTPVVPAISVDATLSPLPTSQATPPASSVSSVSAVSAVSPGPSTSGTEGEAKFGRRSEDSSSSVKTLKVDQEKIDRLMNLIGEMVVAKNGLPYLASRAEEVFGVRDLAREIKSQYAVINRIAEEMQDAIMQVRMMPVSFVFQRFPRLVRDLSRKLGKEVSLVLEGEDTEADKNIIEALADPLIHIVRNSLDHGLELPQVRIAAGKPAEGRLLIRASQEAGRVIIDISDDGKGIDPAIIKRKAYEKGLIDEATLERISDQEAINLVFAAGFSTVDVVSDLSGRGVGMDVVRMAVEQVNGSVSLESDLGKGTRLRLSLPLSIAVSNVMIVESGKQIFGIPMEMVVETVRIPSTSIHTIKTQQTAVLRGRIVPLRSLNTLLATDQPQRPNDDDELATLVIRLQGEHVGIVVDDFRGVVDIILKPMGGILGCMQGYAGSALLGDGSVLMVLNPKELL
ncbi:chemotaxis protein CheA [Herbaspirillum sp. RTI4]|uniref:chemotaxis protein CheA n=1 Tax=Herbaspirillum sp. RTI4 TaxID=3048640 RepID=UPI002AB345CD|nr:chemotaxis protein CheA [Herbaspirillum sp. RTI4]MDY7579165.1 chemotaxis protein CheA [Herbaspirillum sp. RTI4]MEA9981256.1 chemotaxis protein CheA [Herbaspirillum sp. RTI4]